MRKSILSAAFSFKPLHFFKSKTHSGKILSIENEFIHLNPGKQRTPRARRALSSDFLTGRLSAANVESHENGSARPVEYYTLIECGCKMRVRVPMAHFSLSPFQQPDPFH
ncbi:hypothetical protein EVAR_31907_1 [Eumeta japonica]|uniref:Uncharacterized protein n=1 Tax=Eumeta variegata TaxID=151549 RepID=A0A4C1XRF4_EUMVA|nr:hypothetical protein EVAR_31907_1 [Eumeta japonica]